MPEAAAAIIKLPSRGLLYPDAGETIEVRPMRTPEVKVMYSGRNAMEKIILIDQACLVTTGLPPVKEWVVQDAFQVFFELRGISLPQHKDYSYPVTCSGCRKPWVRTVQIPEGMEVEYAPDTLKEPFEAKLPSGKVIGLRHMRAKDSLDVDEHTRKVMQRAKTQLDPEDVAFTYRMTKQIVTIDGQKAGGGYMVQTVIDALSYEDLVELQQTVDDHDFGPKLIDDLECPHCHFVDDYVFRLRADFFRPKRSKRGVPQDAGDDSED